MSFIQVENLHYTYHPRGHAPIEALKGVSLSVGRGEYLAVIGANGSGKTTLALHLNGILLPSAGSVVVDGRSTSDSHSMREIRNRIGMVFQSPEDQMVATVVEEDVAFGPENLGVDEGRLKILVREALQRVGMWEERLRPSQQLSAGQMQRVAIAGALAMNPQCLVFDEATSMLDPVGAKEVLRIMKELHRQGITIISITHKMEEAVRAERIVVLHRGALEMDGTPEDVFAHRRLKEWRLQPPGASMLAQRLREHIPGLPLNLFDAEELASALIVN